MSRLKTFIHEIHRRSLWQVLTIFLGASWAVLEVVDQVIARYLLPEWVYGASIVLLLLGLPIVLATAFVREDSGGSQERPAGLRDPTLLAAPADESDGGGLTSRITGLLTWPRAILGGVLAFTGLALVSAFIVMQGTARVTEAHGAAGGAFEERAWIVVTDFQAPEGEEDVALAAREALTIDLEQSTYINVFGRDQVEPVLRRMGLPDTTTLDRRTALEVAEREGLAAVLIGSVSRLGDDYVFGARVARPRSEGDIIAVRAAASEDRLLEGVETLSREIRRRLGEEQDEIGRSRPLPEVTTRSLEALKVYAKAREVLERDDDYRQAGELAEEAIRLDSTFAMAYRLAAVAVGNQGRPGASKELASRAYELRDRLTDIERLHVEAYYHSQVPLDPKSAAETYELILSRYPDDDRATNNLGVMLSIWFSDYEGAYQAYLKSLELNPYLALGYSNAISQAFRTHRWEAADSLMAVAETRGLFNIFMALQRLGVAFALEELDRADALCDSLLAGSLRPAVLAEIQRSCGGYDIAQGRLERGVARLSMAAHTFAKSGQFWNAHFALVGLMLAEETRGRPSATRTHMERVFGGVEPDSIPQPDQIYVRTGLRTQAGLLGRRDLMEWVETRYPPYPETSHFVSRYGEGLAAAASALAGQRAETTD